MSIKTKVKDFWRYFLKNQNEIEQALTSQDSKKIKEWEEKLSDECVKASGCYLSLENDDNFHVLVFEPNKDKTSQIVCVYMKKFAPASLADNWMIFDCIPPLSEKIDHYRFRVDEKDYMIDDLSVTFIEIPKAKDSFIVSIACEAFDQMSQSDRDVIAETYVQHVLGDLILNCYVDHIECTSSLKEGYKYVPMKEAYDEIIEFMDLHHYRSYADCTQIYTVYKLNEDEISDEVLKDRVLISTIQPMNFVEVMNQERRSLNQINRLGGEVGYLILEIDQFNETEAQRKRVLEKELNDLLYELGIARITGSGVAAKRIYFEVFVFDKEEFKQAIVKVVGRLHLPMTYLVY